ncbi:MAG: alpha/beta hydrolase [Planctomycetes bacterium]|nr:alpha/beta hydrolase [Planctomycetota bacterium]
MGDLNPIRALMAMLGSTAPPALLAAGYPELEVNEQNFPPGSELVELEVRRSTLRGAFVPSDPDSPVVLHLLESMGSVTYGTQHALGYPLLWQLRDRGFASLMVDYRGVGASEGWRTPRHVREDAQAMFAEALRRTGGRSHRIVLRGSSFGTLAVASLLKHGARPRAVTLIAPVRAETVAKNWFFHYYHPFLARAVTAFLRLPIRVDIVRALRRWRGPLLVSAPENDYVLPPREQPLIRDTVRRRGARWVSTPYTHAGHVLANHWLGDDETSFLDACFPGLPDLESRDPAHPAISRRWKLLETRLYAALDRHSHRDPLVVEWMRRIPHAHLASLSQEQLDELLDLRGPAGPIPLRDLILLSSYLAETGTPRAVPALEVMADELGLRTLQQRALLAKAAGLPSAILVPRNELAPGA